MTSIQKSFQNVLLSHINENCSAYKLSESLSIATGVTSQTIMNIINGKPSTVFIMQKILDALGYEVKISKA